MMICRFEVGVGWSTVVVKHLERDDSYCELDGSKVVTLSSVQVDSRCWSPRTTKERLIVPTDKGVCDKVR